MLVDELVEILASGCEIYDLEHVRCEGMPTFPVLRPGFSYTLHRHHESTYRPSVDGPRSGASGLITMSDHSGTHIDALCHQSSDLTFADGTRIDQNIETPWGFTKLGAESIAPIVAKGVLIDVATFSKDALPEEHEISKEECEFALQKERVNIKKGDVALIRTGFGKQWNNPDRYAKAAGVSKEASLWLLDLGVFAVGIDNLSWDVPKSTDPETKSKFAAHLFLLARKGVYIIENLNLEELSNHKVYEFLFVGSPLKFKGATAGPIRPLAFAPT